MEPVLDLTAERLMAELEEVDNAIATHLCTLFRGGRSVTVSDCRRAIVAWCSSAEARVRFKAEILDGACHALDTMDDALLAPLVRDFLRSSAGRRGPSAA